MRRFYVAIPSGDPAGADGPSFDQESRHPAGFSLDRQESSGKKISDGLRVAMMMPTGFQREAQ
jgi:hypothetical protein